MVRWAVLPRNRSWYVRGVDARKRGIVGSVGVGLGEDQVEISKALLYSPVAMKRCSRSGRDVVVGVTVKNASITALRTGTGSGCPWRS